MIHGRIRKRTGLISSSVGTTMEQVLQACSHTKAAVIELTSMPNLCRRRINPSSFYMEIHLNSPRKRNQLVVLLVVAEAEHLKDIRIHIHF